MSVIVCPTCESHESRVMRVVFRKGLVRVSEDRYGNTVVEFINPINSNNTIDVHLLCDCEHPHRLLIDKTHGATFVSAYHRKCQGNP